MEIGGSDSTIHPWKREFCRSLRLSATTFDFKQIYYDDEEIRYPFYNSAINQSESQRTHHATCHRPSQQTLFCVYDLNQSVVFPAQ
jgi:hypothetical protein